MGSSKARITLVALAAILAAALWLVLDGWEVEGEGGAGAVVRPLAERDVLDSPTPIPPATLEPAAQTDERVVELSFEPLVRLSGVVRDEDGRSLERARINPTISKPGSGGSTTSIGPTTGAAGAFDLRGPRPGHFLLRIEHPAHLAGELDLGELAPGGSREGIEIVLARGGRIAGRLTWPDEVPAEGQRVGDLRLVLPAPATVQGGVRGGASESRTIHALRRDGSTRVRGGHGMVSDGRYRSSGLGPGPHDIEVGGGPSHRVRRVNLPEGELLELDFDLD